MRQTCPLAYWVGPNPVFPPLSSTSYSSTHGFPECSSTNLRGLFLGPLCPLSYKHGSGPLTLSRGPVLPFTWFCHVHDLFAYNNMNSFTAALLCFVHTQRLSASCVFVQLCFVVSSFSPYFVICVGGFRDAIPRANFMEQADGAYPTVSASCLDLSSRPRIGLPTPLSLFKRNLGGIPNPKAVCWGYPTCKKQPPENPRKVGQAPTQRDHCLL